MGRTGDAGEVETELKRAIGPRLLTVFILGDVLGAGIYALVGEVGAEVGGAIWTSFLAAFVLAAFTAFAYAELVSKYPRAAGAALYTNKAFGAPFFTFVVAFAVMSSGIASASTLARAFAGDYLSEFVDLPLVLAAIAFLAIVAAINLRGIAESVKVNLVLTADRGHRPGADRADRPRRGRRRLGRLLAQLRVQGGGGGFRGDRRRHGALLLRDDRLRGLGERRRGDAGAEPHLSARALPRARDRRRALPARHDGGVRGGADRRPDRLGRSAARGGRAGAARASPPSCSRSSP